MCPVLLLRTFLVCLNTEKENHNKQAPKDGCYLCIRLADLVK